MVWLPDWKWEQLQKEKANGKGAGVIWNNEKKGGSGKSAEKGPAKGSGWSGKGDSGGDSWGSHGGKVGGKGGGWNQKKWNNSKVDPKKTMWVGNIAEGVTYKELLAHAKTAGTDAVWAEVYTWKGKGTGAIGFRDEEGVKQGILMLSASELQGQVLECDAWEKPQKSAAAST
mmetsp:Transcript_79627/g.237181  ORF Transcript_79627/g.237181 Transcript_79627/m.237181 type:complete len:172 (-) Transcript_79627:70-585(-)